MFDWEGFKIPASLNNSYSDLTGAYKKIAPQRDISLLTDLENTLKNTVNCATVEWRPLTEGHVGWALGPKFNTPSNSGVIKVLFPFLSVTDNILNLERPIAIFYLGVVTETDVDQVFNDLTNMFKYQKSPIPENDF